ncbi:hypothetical protein L7F22_064481 [Adiantum nelumboides]|nr:hypothetical protein [Adiantum nelumboides]
MLEMPNRHSLKDVPSPAVYRSRSTKKEPELETKKNRGRSVKKLVRSLSDSYAAVTSPLTCKKKISCNSRTPSLKTMKTTAATSLLPLNPAFSVSCRPVRQSASKKETLSLLVKPAISVSCRPVTQPASMKTDSLSSTVVASHMQRAPAIAMSKRLLHVQPLARTGTPVSLPSMNVHRRQSKEGKQKLIPQRSPPSALAPQFLPLQNEIDGDKETGSSIEKLTQIGLYQALLLESGESRYKQAPDALEVLSSINNNPIKFESEQLEAVFNQKDDELERLQTAGLMLEELCVKQDDEIKTLKAAFPATLREVADVREACQKQEEELAYSRMALPALQAQVNSLNEQLRSLTEELTQLKVQKDASSERVSSYFHDREASQSSSSCLSMEPSPVPNGFLEHLRHSRERESFPTVCQDRGPMPAQACETASSNCSSVTSIERTSGVLGNAKHRRGFSAVLSVENLLKGSGKRSGRWLLSDRDTVDTLQELYSVADREQAMLEARCADAVKELRSSSSRFTSLEPIKSILTCASPQLHEDTLQKEKLDARKKFPQANMWNLKPT